MSIALLVDKVQQFLNASLGYEATCNRIFIPKRILYEISDEFVEQQLVARQTLHRLQKKAVDAQMIPLELLEKILILPAHLLRPLSVQDVNVVHVELQTFDELYKNICNLSGVEVALDQLRQENSFVKLVNDFDVCENLHSTAFQSVGQQQAVEWLHVIADSFLQVDNIIFLVLQDFLNDSSSLDCGHAEVCKQLKIF